MNSLPMGFLIRQKSDNPDEPSIILNRTPVQREETSKGNCAVCRKPIQINILEAFNKVYHSNCFICSTCGCFLTITTAKQRDGQLFCEKDFAMGWGQNASPPQDQLLPRFVPLLTEQQKIEIIKEKERILPPAEGAWGRIILLGPADLNSIFGTKVIISKLV